MKVQSITMLLAVLLSCATAGAVSFPSQITTRDGRVYNETSKLRVDPDGILVSYQPESRGFGLAKLKFADLPDDLQKQYNYDPKAAADFEKQQADANREWRSQATANDVFAHYQALAELNRSLAGDGAVTYSISIDGGGKVSVNGTTGNPHSITVTNVSIPTFLSVPYTHGYQTDYVPMPAPMSQVVPQY